MRIPALLLSLLATVAVGGCGSSTAGEDSDSSGEPTLSISAIPDQDPEPLARLYPVVAQELSQKLGVPVRYRPVTDYAASVTAFKTGGLDAVWFGGLTGVQAEAQVPGARPLAQRDIDADFHSVFIASRRSDIAPIRDVVGLSVRQDTRFTFGSESSTSGRLMPEYFLGQAGIEEEDFRGALGFSGSHDKTIALVASGTYDAGVLNEQVWNQRVEEGAVDASKVKVVFRTPAYHDYYWLARPDLDERFGDGFTDRLRQALLDMRDPKVLELFGAERFIPVRPDDHDETRQVAERLGLLDEGGREPRPDGSPRVRRRSRQHALRRTPCGRRSRPRRASWRARGTRRAERRRQVNASPPPRRIDPTHVGKRPGVRRGSHADGQPGTAAGAARDRRGAPAARPRGAAERGAQRQRGSARAVAVVARGGVAGRPGGRTGGRGGAASRRARRP